MQYRILLFITVVLSVCFTSCTDIMCVVSGYKPSEIKNNCQTPEPGTELSARCNLIARYVDKFSVNPDSVYQSKRKYLDAFKPRNRYIGDKELITPTHTIPVRIYCDVPARQRNKLPVLVFYHGGGFVWGSIDVFDRYCRKLAKETGTILVSVGYRLAPEHPFPAAVLDSYKALEWVDENIKAYGGDPQKIIVMGESAGGNLAAVMPLMSRDSCGPDISAQIIVCGATTFEEKSYPSREYFLTDNRAYLISEDYMRRCKNNYLPDTVDVTHPYVSPLVARFDSLMPPAMVITAECDPLRDEGREYAMKMKNAGIDVLYREYEGMLHAFMNFYPFIEESRHAIKDVDVFIDSLYRHDI